MTERTLIVPMRIQSVANLREHWSARGKRAKAQRYGIAARLHAAGFCRGASVVTLTRIAPRPLDTDNLSSGFKALRGGVADWLHIDDSTKTGIEWRYAQRRGKPNEYAVEVNLE